MVPTQVRAAGRSLPSPVRMRTTQSGIAATSKAANPDGTVCSATVTMPTPQNRNSRPCKAPLAICFGGTRSARQPRRKATAVARMHPAMMNRTPVGRNGGWSATSTTTRIPRYVEPQTTYTMPRAVRSDQRAGTRA